MQNKKFFKIIIFIVVLCIPIIYSFFYLKSYWDPYGNLTDMKIAIVNLDKGVDGTNQGSELVKELKDKDVIVIEDIIDSGNTLARLMPMLEERKPADICICTLLDKPERREVEVDVKYNGFNIPDEFVVGYGLDYDQSYRNLPFVGVLHLDEEA